MDKRFMVAQPGDVILLTVKELVNLLISREMVNSEFNREDETRWPSKKVANYIWRLDDASKRREQLRQAGLLSPFNIGLNDVILVSVDEATGKLKEENGHHRCEELLGYFGYGEKFKKAKGTEKEIPWYNKHIAGNTIKTMNHAIAKRLWDSVIPIVVTVHDSVHQRGCNNNDSYNGSENVHSEYGGSTYAQMTSSIGPIYKNSRKQAEFHRMFSFGVMAGLADTNTKLVQRGFELFEDCPEAAQLTQEAFDWWKQFNFLNESTAKCPNNLNLVRWRAICELAQRRWSHGFAGAGRSLKDCVTDAEKWEKLISDDGSLKAIMKRRLLIATFTLKELKRMTRALKKIDDELVSESANLLVGGHRDSAGAGNDWLENEAIRPIFVKANLMAEWGWSC